jgi:hypothetical protein
MIRWNSTRIAITVASLVSLAVAGDSGVRRN